MAAEDREDIMDQAPCGFIRFSLKGDIVGINTTLLQYLGYTRDDFAIKKIESILTLSSRIFYQTHFYPLIQLQGKANEIFLTLLSKDKTEIPVLVNAEKRDSPDPVIYCVLIPVEQRGKYEELIIKAKKTAEDALYKNEELIGAKQELELHKEELDRKLSRLQQTNYELIQFGEVISHDLQEPLRKISLFIDILFRYHGQLATEESEALNKIRNSCNRIREIITSLEKMAYLVVEENNIIAVDLNAVIFVIEEQLQQPGESKFSITREGLPVLEAYAGQMEVLFSQLIDNSLKFCQPAKEVFINIEGSLIKHNSFKTTRDKYKYIDFVKIVYTDNSLGFDNKYSEYVFLMLKKLQSDLPGLGFGLALCKKIVENHFGSISVDSRPGEGVSFTILLPLKQYN